MLVRTLRRRTPKRQDVLSVGPYMVHYDGLDRGDDYDLVFLVVIGIRPSPPVDCVPLHIDRWHDIAPGFKSALFHPELEPVQFDWPSMHPGCP